MTKPTILSGIRATGKLHIGNYLGALKQFVEQQEQDKFNCFYMIADLHALTTPFDPKELKQSTLEVFAEYMAAGLDPDKSVIFPQSLVPAHSELTWIFNCITPIGELERMTQYKDKSKVHKTNINMGLLDYPVLMASDILIYKPQLVPVGDDQSQHLELARIIARKFNNKFGEVFPEPKNLTMKPLRIMSLSDPTKKMSKTADKPVNLEDEPEVIMQKVKKAVTATDNNHKSPGVTNLISLLRYFDNENSASEFEIQIQKGSIKYSELKEVLAKTISQYFAPFRESKKRLLAKPKVLEEMLRDGAEKAKKTANKTLEEAKEKIGLI